MRLLTGPPGAGKTAILLSEFQRELRAGNDGIRLLTPTATLSQHLQNQVAREGLVFHRDLIQTLSAFAEAGAGDVTLTPPAVLYLLVEQAARRLRRPEFAKVVDTAGFCASLARTIEEFASAGCDSGRLAEYLPDSPLGPAFVEVYAEVERDLAARGLELRGRRLERVAARIESEGAGGIRMVWLAGFHALPDPELHLIAALGKHCEVTLALGDRDLTPVLRKRLDRMGIREEPVRRKRPEAQRLVVKAPAIEREAEEIGWRILAASAGRSFREMGIIVRSPDPYVPVLQSTLERFGIPARFYFEERLDRHAAIRYLSGAVDAMLGGWDYGETLQVIRLAPRFADWNGMDRFDFAVREQMPNAGLGGLRALAENSERLLHRIDALSEMEEWRAFALEPQDWAARFRTLRNQFRPAQPEPATARAEIWRGQAAALDEFDEALDEAACALESRRSIPLEDFWRAVKAVLRLKPLRLPDARRNVVHVLSAHEARQWVLPIVFVCGMVEKQFPQIHPQDPFFPDGVRAQLNGAGIRVRTAADFEREERALFDSAVTRATMLTTLTYPEFSARGDTNLRSLFLEEWAVGVAEESAHAVKLRPRDGGLPGGGTREGIRTPELLAVLKEKTGKLSPTGLESYLQCPFQYFGGKVLRLKKAPVRPEDRLDFLVQGNIVHEVLAGWYGQPQDIGELFDQVYERYLEEKQIPPGYHTERLRFELRDHLKAFAEDGYWPRENFTSHMEEPFVFPLQDGLEIAGKIDRLDVTEDRRAYVLDYKYSASKGIKLRKNDPTLLQAPVYLMAAKRMGYEPAGVYYIGLKKELLYVGWEMADLSADWEEAAVQRILQVAAGIAAGRMDVAPADRGKCRFCDCRDVCRVTVSEAVELAEGA
jgi:ATP-dependent helicase/DNAse subunit B